MAHQTNLLDLRDAHGGAPGVHFTSFSDETET